MSSSGWGGRHPRVSGSFDVVLLPSAATTGVVSAGASAAPGALAAAGCTEAACLMAPGDNAVQMLAASISRARSMAAGNNNSNNNNNNNNNSGGGGEW